MCECIEKCDSQILLSLLRINLFSQKSSCFSWNNTRPNDKVKRSGSVDSLIDAQQNSTKDDNNIVSIGNHFALNPTETIATNKRDKLMSSTFSHRFKEHMTLGSTSSVQLFESQQNLEDIPLSPTASFRITKTLSGIQNHNNKDMFSND